MKRYLLTLILCVCAASATHAQMVMLKTNALMDAAAVPNLGLEIHTSSTQSLCLSGYMGYGAVYQDINVQAAFIDYRFYLGDKGMLGFFLGPSIIGAHYDMTFKREAFMGDVIGGGLTCGWMWKIGGKKSKYWYMEAEAAVGFLHFKHKHRWVQDYVITREYNQNGNMFMPYKVGIGVCYMIPYKTKKAEQKGK